MNRTASASATAPTNPAPWPLIMLSAGDDAAYHAKMAALLEERILCRLWNIGEARTLHGLSRAALQALANEVASFATGRPGFDLTDPSAAILDALAARAAAAPRPVAPSDELAIQHYVIDMLERQLQRARRRGDDPVEINSIENGIRAHRLRAAKLKRQMADRDERQTLPVERTAATDPAFH